MRNKSKPLSPAELRLIRIALSEAIDSLASIEDGCLPPRPENDNRLQKTLRKTWLARIAAWNKLRKKMGGVLPGEKIAWREMDGL